MSKFRSWAQLTAYVLFSSKTHRNVGLPDITTYQPTNELKISSIYHIQNFPSNFCFNLHYPWFTVQIGHFESERWCWDNTGVNYKLELSWANWDKLLSYLYLSSYSLSLRVMSLSNLWICLWYTTGWNIARRRDLLFHSRVGKNPMIKNEIEFGAALYTGSHKGRNVGDPPYPPSLWASTAYFCDWAVWISGL